MAAKAQLEVPAGVQRLYRRFELWRRSHRGRLPIPERLWASAAAVAREHGVFPNGQDFAPGIRQAQADGGGRRGKPAADDTDCILELMPQGIGPADCLIELEGPRGKMRIQWKGVTASDLAGLIRVWESA